MIAQWAAVLTRWSQRYLPDPFIFVILLSLVVFVMGLLIAGQTPFQMILHWQNGFWNLLTFSMQMCLVIVLGYAVADSPAVNRWLKALSDTIRSSRQAVYVVALVSVIGGMISYGFGLVLGSLFAIEVAKSGYRRNIRMHYPLLGAAAYLSLMVWHAGLSGSAPLLVATEGHFLQDKIGIIPVADTLFSPMNLFVIAAQLIFVPLFALLVHPKNEKELLPIDRIWPETAWSTPVRAPQDNTKPMTPAARLENSRLLSLVIAVGGLIYLAYHFATKGFDLNLNVLNALFLFVGILLHGTPMNYVRSIAEGTKGVSGVILQFPFYAGIAGMMADSGLVQIIANWFVQISNAVTYPLFTFISASIVNFFIPSGGGQWAVQGPVMIEAAAALGVSYEKTIMTLAYGDQLTNMMQPFWALALLGITRLKASQIIGYSTAIMLLSTWIYVVASFLPA